MMAKEVVEVKVAEGGVEEEEVVAVKLFLIIPIYWSFVAQFANRKNLIFKSQIFQPLSLM